MKLKIAVIDDEKPNRDLYKTVLRREGHIVRVFESLSEGINYVSNKDFDVVFLDNHFEASGNRPTEYGIDRVKELRENKPDCYIILASGKEFLPSMVSKLVEAKVDQFIEHPAPSEVIRESLRQIYVNKEREWNAVSKVIDKIKKSSESPENFLNKICSYFSSSHNDDVFFDIKYKANTNELYVLTPMKRVVKVNRGEIKKFTSCETSIVEDKIELASKFNLGVSLGDSSKSLLTSPIGVKIKAELENKANIALKEMIEKSFSESYQITITDQEVSEGVYSKEVFSGFIYSRHLFEITSKCNICHSEEICELSCFVPEKYETETCIYDRYGDIIIDGRDKYKLWNGPKAILQDV